MRILAISDIHGYLPNLGGHEADVLLIAGDIVPDPFNPNFPPSLTNRDKARWLRGEFAAWLDKQQMTHKVVIAGNHDIPMMQNPGLMSDVPCIYLQDETVEIDGMRIHGSPWTPTFGSGWAFMKPDSSLTEEWDKIPHDVDILVTHGPAYGWCDQTDAFWGSEHVGSQTLTNKLLYGEYPNLKLHVFGHIHPGYGKIDRGGITHANVAFVNHAYLPTNQPMFFEV